ncbi:hypothetical protein PHET_11750 [Paragonimus heterotremus]|uniref:Uncharacterized protein n=1 Tax=Paragonimus heterotremus TaxID=100268 RepID=A0A8J4WD89_9TREM|nr:hypothetical protein PHET_11750 [Paragonimus heterotremus]
MSPPDENILHSQMSTATVCGSVSKSSEHQPTSNTETLTTQDQDAMAQFCRSVEKATVEDLWKAHLLVNDAFGLFRDETAGNSPLHMLILATVKLAQANGCSEIHDPESSINESYPPPAWSAAAIGLLYRLVVVGRCSVNAQNWVGNTALHLACLRPKAGVLVCHLIRLGE